MEQRISFVTLGVVDPPRAVDFYERVLGWKAEYSPSGGGVFFDLNGVVFALWPHDALAKDMGLTADPVSYFPDYEHATQARTRFELPTTRFGAPRRMAACRRSKTDDIRNIRCWRFRKDFRKCCVCASGWLVVLGKSSDAVHREIFT